jgi:hypothetical protein
LFFTVYFLAIRFLYGNFSSKTNSTDIYFYLILHSLKLYLSTSLFQLTEQLMTTVAPPPAAADAAALAAAAPAAAAAAAADHMFMIEEVPARSTEAPAPATETQQPPLTEVQQPLAEVSQPAAPPADDQIPVTTESIVSPPATEEEEVPQEAKREDLPVPVAETTAAAATEAAAPGEEAVAALRDVPTPSVDFGLIQEVTGVLREEPPASS